jgi:hypothetical protein
MIPWKSGHPEPDWAFCWPSVNDGFRHVPVVKSDSVATLISRSLLVNSLQDDTGILVINLCVPTHFFGGVSLIRSLYSPGIAVPRGLPFLCPAVRESLLYDSGNISCNAQWYVIC